MKTITLTSNEIRTLECLLWVNPCRSGCAYDEMRNSKKYCDDCKLTEAIHTITEKIRND